MENYCKNCGALIKDDARFCQDCGEKVENTSNPCPNCGNELEENTSFCQECGTNLSNDTTPEDDTCPNCGENIEDSENFCENCGYDLNTPKATNNKSFIEQYKIPIIIIITAAIVVFICVIALSMTAHDDNSYGNYDVGTQTVSLAGIKFEIPGDYRLMPTTIDYGYENYVSTYEQSYSNGEDTITLAVLYSPGANVDANSIVQQTGGGVQKTMMGYDGTYGEFNDGYAFFFGIDNKVCMVAVSSVYVFDQIRILG